MNIYVLTGAAALVASVAIAANAGDLGRVVEPVVLDCARKMDLATVRQDGGMSAYCNTLVRILIWQKGELYAKRLIMWEALSNPHTGNSLADTMAKDFAEQLAKTPEPDLGN